MNIDWQNLPFGYVKTDYNVRCYFRNGEWGEIEVSSSEHIEMHMAASSLHYGQEAFEGLKAYRCKDGKIRIFRPEANAERLQSTCRGIMMPELPTEKFVEMCKKVIKMNERFIPPYGTGASLYLLPAIEAGIREGRFERDYAYHVVRMCCQGAGKAWLSEYYAVKAARDYLGVPNEIGQDGRILGGLIELLLQSVFCDYEVEAFNENEVIYVIDRAGLEITGTKTLPECHKWFWEGAVKTVVDPMYMLWEEDSPEGKMRLKIAKRIDKFQ